MTDGQFSAIPKAPAFEEEMGLTLASCRAMGKSLAEWDALKARVAEAIAEEGQAYLETLTLSPTHFEPPPVSPMPGWSASVGPNEDPTRGW